MKLRPLNLFALLPVLLCAQAVKVDKYRLPNGMTVILHVDHAQPVACVNIWYKVGSKDEPDRRSGFAHLFEHLMFMGTKRVPNGQFDILMERYGGNNNASTTEDRTNYFESGPASLLPTLLWLEADRLEGLASAMDQKKLDLQREVVKNERRESVENAPYGKAYDAINGLMFPKGHPYHTTVIGSMEDLDNATVRDVEEFFQTFYVPNNASMVVAGDFDPKAIKPLIAKLFSTLPRENDVVRRPIPAIQMVGVKRTTMVDNVQSPKTIMVWHSPAATKPGDVEMRLAGSILSSGYTSRLNKALVVDRQLATEVEAYQSPLLLGSLFMIEATAREGVALEKLERAIEEVVVKFAKEGPSQDELDRQIAQMMFKSVENLQSVEQRADKLNEFEFYFGSPNSFDAERKMFRAATTNSIRQVAAKTLDLNRRLVLRVIPQVGAPAVNPRDTQPTIGKDRPFTFPKPIEFRLANGIPVSYWVKDELPLSTVAVRFSQGASSDPAGKSGLAELTANMLDEGAGARNADQFANALDQLGAQFSAGADQEGTQVNLSALTDKLDASMGLLADAIERPALKSADWDRVKSLQIEGLRAELDDPNTVALRVANREFFGKGHPYALSAKGSAGSVARISLPDVKASYGRLSPQNVRIFASGSLPSTQMKALLDRHFGSWKKVSTGVKSQPMPEVESDRQRVVIVDKPGAVQTVIRIMMPTESFASPNRYALTELGVAFGGTFTSRLNRNLREEKGYTYGIGLRFVFTKQVAYCSASTAVRVDVTGASLSELIKEFAKVKTGDLTSEEVAKAKNTVRVDFINAVGTEQGLLDTVITYAANGIGFGQIGAELERFANQDMESLNRVAKSGLPLDRALIVLVGDKGEILKQIAGLGLAQPEVMTAGG
ncbi:MAG: insulinase family protein [Fimbriimonadaceae bacterium]|nr:insulinase family protein [Fimbriimonadaceae bacterium]